MGLEFRRQMPSDAVKPPKTPSETIFLGGSRSVGDPCRRHGIKTTVRHGIESTVTVRHGIESMLGMALDVCQAFSLRHAFVMCRRCVCCGLCCGSCHVLGMRRAICPVSSWCCAGIVRRAFLCAGHVAGHHVYGILSTASGTAGACVMCWAWCKCCSLNPQSPSAAGRLTLGRPLTHGHGPWPGRWCSSA